jgi:hypothetical protein
VPAAALIAAADRLVNLKGLFLYDFTTGGFAARKRVSPPALQAPVDASALLRAYPRLTALGVCGTLELDPTEHDQLCHLWVHTPAPPEETLRALGACAFPSLRLLELNLVDDGDPAAAVRAEQAARTLLPGVRVAVTVVTSRLDIASEVLVDDMADACAFIERYLAATEEPLLPGDGYDEAELGIAERRLGFPLPAAMRAAYLRFGRRYRNAHDRLLGPDEVRVDADMLVFRTGDPGKWAVPLYAPEDPPVMLRLSNPGGTDGGWVPFADQFSEACVELVLSESVRADGPMNGGWTAPA